MVLEMNSWRLNLCVLLSLALLLTGVPVHGQTSSEATADTSHSAAGQADTDSTRPGCPFHDSEPTVEHASATGDHGSDMDSPCCGPDCRCQCAGLTLMVALSPASSTGQARLPRLPHAAILPANFHLDTPLRPPQA